MYNFLPFTINFIYFILLVTLILYIDMERNFLPSLNSLQNISLSKKMQFLRMSIKSNFLSYSPLVLSVFISMLYITPNYFFSSMVDQRSLSHMILGILILYIFIDIRMFSTQKYQIQDIPVKINLLLLLFVILTAVFNLFMLNIFKADIVIRLVNYIILWFAVMHKTSYFSLKQVRKVSIYSIVLYFIFFQFFNNFLFSYYELAFLSSVFFNSTLLFCIIFLEVIASLTLEQLYNEIIINSNHRATYKLLLLCIFILLIIGGYLLI